MTATPDRVVAAGADLLADAVAAQAVDVERVDWRPPMPGTEDDLVAVAADPRRRDANARALVEPCSASPPTSSTSRPPPTCSASSPGSSCTPARRSAGTAPPGRCGAR